MLNLVLTCWCLGSAPLVVVVVAAVAVVLTAVAGLIAAFIEFDALGFVVPPPP